MEHPVLQEPIAGWALVPINLVTRSNNTNLLALYSLLCILGRVEKNHDFYKNNKKSDFFLFKSDLFDFFYLFDFF